MKENLDFYPHQASSDESPKFKALRVHYGGERGWAFEGRFWALNNRIAKATDCWLDLGKPYVKSTVACDLGITIAEFDELVDFLANPDECGLLIKDGTKISTERVQEAFRKIQGDREEARKRKKRGSVGNRNSSGGHCEGLGEPGKRLERSKEEEKRIDQQQQDNTPQEESPEQGDEAFAQAIRGYLEPARIAFDTETIGDVEERLSSLRLDAGFVEFAVKKLNCHAPRDRSAYLRTAILTFDNWADEYRLIQQQQYRQQAARPPTTCPDCGVGPPSFGSGPDWAMCRECGGEWQLKSGSWAKVEPVPAG